MTEAELNHLLATVASRRTETQVLEVKSANEGCPTRLYDTLSSFSNQDEGGTILFGVDETKNFAEVGVYDAQDLQKHVVEQCNQMDPVVRPLFTTTEKNGLVFVSAEIPGIDMTQRPCFYAGKGRMKGSYVRVGEADEQMTEYEVYSYEAFRKKYKDDIRPCENATADAFDPLLLEEYLLKRKASRPNLSSLDPSRILELTGVTCGGRPTLASMLLFGAYPQAYFPQLCIIATAVPGKEIGVLGTQGERFLDNRRIEGTLPQMLDEALSFLRKNMKQKTIIDPQTGQREDRLEYPLVAVREAILNALIHRDYSIHTEGMPIQIILYTDRLEIRNPGGIYGKLRVDQLGKMQPDTRNPVIAVAMELLGKTENRYSGIPTIYRELREMGLPTPIFSNQRGEFAVTFRQSEAEQLSFNFEAEEKREVKGVHALLLFCKTPKTRQEISSFLGITTQTHAIKHHIMPLIAAGKIGLLYPEKPRSSKQKYYTITDGGAEK